MFSILTVDYGKKIFCVKFSNTFSKHLNPNRLPALTDINCYDRRGRNAVVRRSNRVNVANRINNGTVFIVQTVR